ncbi:hypothetical protein C1752_03837 [Acaryochloris thomasi RCC1774]|uniref:Uncharacterized protein n=1 Tax=Acaryochloris thomasi RCC1774 TaxID=1764569 RepID=A0A2W1JER1_9CYAN|nr:hypothetical protein C1752_03837 [Acaryochloris thomasi RCC1774]
MLCLSQSFVISLVCQDCISIVKCRWNGPIYLLEQGGFSEVDTDARRRARTNKARFNRLLRSGSLKSSTALRSSSTLIGDLAYLHGHILTLLLLGHCGTQLEEFFEALSVVFDAATNIDTLSGFVVGIVGFAQFVGIVEIYCSVYDHHSSSKEYGSPSQVPSSR